MEPCTSIDYPPGRRRTLQFLVGRSNPMATHILTGCRIAARFGVALSIVLVLGWACGCDHPVAQALHPSNVLHELRPHRLWRKNQNRPLTENAYFSVSPAPKVASPGNQLGRSTGKQLVGDRQPE